MNSSLVEVYSGNTWEVEIVKGLLENEEIKVFLRDEFCGTLAPWYSSGGGAGAIKVVVPVEDYDRAILIVHEYENNKKGEFS